MSAREQKLPFYGRRVTLVTRDITAVTLGPVTPLAVRCHPVLRRRKKPLRLFLLGIDASFPQGSPGRAVGRSQAG